MRSLGTAQQGLWSGYLLNEDRAMFNTAECIAFAGKIHAATMIASVQQAVRECEALSGVFVADEDAVFFKPCELPVVVQQVQVPAGADAEGWVRDWAMRDIRIAIDLQRELPCRFVLLQAEGFLYSCVHHIALDGYGTNLLYQRIAELYGAAMSGDSVPASEFGLCSRKTPSGTLRAVPPLHAVTGWKHCHACRSQRASVSAVRRYRPHSSVTALRSQSLCGRH